MVRHRLAEASHVSPPNFSTPRLPGGEFFLTIPTRRDENAATMRPPLAFSHACLAAVALSSASAHVFAAEMPKDFVYLRDIDPTILQDMRYAGRDNFTGEPVPG